MSGAFEIVFLTCLAGLYGLFWLLFLILFINGRRKKSRSLALWGGIPLALSSLFAAFCLASAALAFVHPPSAADIYESTFGLPPTTDVKSLLGSDWRFGDSGMTYLKFKASPATIKRLTSKSWIRLISPEAIEQKALFPAKADTDPDSDTPKWWEQTITHSTVTYVATNRFREFRSEDETLTYDKTTHETYYYFQGID